jgi:hypothetical protein
MVEAFEQFIQLEETIHNFQPSKDNGIWTYIWGGSSFSTSKAYKQLAGSCWVHPTFKWIWGSSCQHKHKVLFWLLAHDRLSIRNIL